jgi:hypothetical protein
MRAELAVSVVTVERRKGGRPRAVAPLKPYTLRVDDELLAGLCREATRQGVNPQVLARVALRRFLAQPERARALREHR